MIAGNVLPVIRETHLLQQFGFSNVNELLEYYLIQCEKEIGKPAAVMQKEEKMKALEYLDKKGALQISKASIRLCQFFQISKFTLYHYLDEIRERQKGETEK